MTQQEVPTAAVADPATSGEPPYRDPERPVSERVEDLLARMTLDEKIGQMTQPERLESDEDDVSTYLLGSVLSGGGSCPEPNAPKTWADMYDGLQRAAMRTPLGIPILYGVDAVHGHGNVVGATVFPHNIGLGATRSPALVREIGEIVAREVTGTGITWNFAPCLGVVRNPRWGRTYESFGELPELPELMTSYIAGLQGDAVGPRPSVMATAKHFIGDGGTDEGDDQGDTRLPENELRAMHLPPFLAALELGVGSIMISLSSWNGLRMHAHHYLVTEVLKEELGFTGIVVSDWNGIDNVCGRDEEEFTGDEVRAAINAGIDMVMVPERWREFIDVLREEVLAERVPMSRIDEANRRILSKKFEQRLFEEPLTDRSYTERVGSAEHRALGRRAVAASQVVLKNDDDLLPLRPGRIFVAGRSADDIGRQCGGWTVHWQGAPGPITHGTTILEGIRDAAGEMSTVVFDRDGMGIDATYDVAIAVVGEEPYAEDEGDRTDDLTLDPADLATINRLRATGVPVVVVLVSGRTMHVAPELPGWNALVAAWLPGTEGDGVADVLFGAAPATGRLPVTWMRSPDQLPINDGDGQDPLFRYGFGLSPAK